MDEYIKGERWRERETERWRERDGERERERVIPGRVECTRKAIDN